MAKKTIPTKTASPAPDSLPDATTATTGRASRTASDSPPPKKRRQTKREGDVVERSYAFPVAEYHALVALKTRLEQMSRPVKKGELLRAGIGLLASLSDDELQAVVGKVSRPAAKGGRTKRSP